MKKLKLKTMAIFAVLFALVMVAYIPDMLCWRYGISFPAFFQLFSDYYMTGNKLSRFNDNDKLSSYALPAMQWAVKHSIVSGIGDALISPNSTATRAQMATILERFLEDFVK